MATATHHELNRQLVKRADDALLSPDVRPSAKDKVRTALDRYKWAAEIAGIDGPRSERWSVIARGRERGLQRILEGV